MNRKIYVTYPIKYKYPYFAIPSCVSQAELSKRARTSVNKHEQLALITNVWKTSAIKTTCAFAFVRACLLRPAVDSVKKISNRLRNRTIWSTH